jgi:CBS domain containing-hemolysin-like protein
MVPRAEIEAIDVDSTTDEHLASNGSWKARA